MSTVGKNLSTSIAAHPGRRINEPMDSPTEERLNAQIPY
jgi:hypothetical protein